MCSCISLWLGQRGTYRSWLHFPADQTGRGAEICTSDHATAVARQHDYVHSLLLGNQHFPSHTHTATAAAQVPLTVVLQLAKKRVEFQGDLEAFLTPLHIPLISRWPHLIRKHPFDDTCICTWWLHNLLLNAVTCQRDEKRAWVSKLKLWEKKTFDVCPTPPQSNNSCPGAATQQTTGRGSDTWMVTCLSVVPNLMIVELEQLLLLEGKTVLQSC